MKINNFCRRKTSYKPFSATLIVGVMVLVALVLSVNFGSAFDWTDDIVAYWNLDDPTEAYDSLGLTNGTNNGATGITGIIGDGYNFSGIETVNFSDSTLLNLGDAPMSISAWVNVTSTNQNGIIASWNDGNGYQFTVSGTVNFGKVGVNSISSTDTITADEWYHVVVVYDASNNVYFYIDGVADSANPHAYTSTFDTSEEYGLGQRNIFNGSMDEIGVWNRTLSQAEVTELYNSGAGLEYATGELTINLVSPTDNSVSSISEINFSANYSLSSTAYNLTNTTYYIWNSTGIFNDTVVVEINGTYNETTNQINDFEAGNYEWNTFVCYGNATYSTCSFAANNFSFAWNPFTVTSVNYSTSALETSLKEFKINISTASGYDLQDGKLVYNGTEYSSVTKTSLGGGNYTLSKSITIPAGTSGFGVENRTFFWNVSVVNEITGISSYHISNSYNQTVNELFFRLCSATFNISLLNFTLIDEVDGVEINGTSNATTFQGTFSLGARAGYLLKSYSINNLSTNLTRFNFCTANYTSAIYADLDLFYTAVDYVEKNYFLNNATLTNITNEINLYLLEETEALEFFIEVEQDLDPLLNATINIDKYFIGEGVYKTVEIDETDTDGEFTAFLDLDKQYRFTISRDGAVLGVIDKRATCDAAPCEITLSLTTSSDNPFSIFDTAFPSNILYNLSFNAVTKIVTFDFIDTTGLATYFRMIVYQGYTNQSSVSIYDNTLYTSSGGMTFNATDYSGDFRVEVYIARSPGSLFDFITFVISDVAEALGVLGLFSALLFILVIIFGLSFKPSVLVLAVPFALTTAKLAGLVSLSTTSLVFVFVLAIIATLVISK